MSFSFVYSTEICATLFLILDGVSSQLDHMAFWKVLVPYVDGPSHQDGFCLKMKSVLDTPFCQDNMIF